MLNMGFNLSILKMSPSFRAHFKYWQVKTKLRAHFKYWQVKPMHNVFAEVFWPLLVILPLLHPQKRCA